jgi:DegV family protein with EDD domain
LCYHINYFSIFTNKLFLDIIQAIPIERITVFTDTASSISQKEADQKGIVLLPVNIITQNGEFDDFTLHPEELYKILGTQTITTTAPNPEKIREFFQKRYDLGDRQFLFIALGSESSSIYQNAFNVSEDFKRDHSDEGLKMVVIDSKALCIAQEFKVDRALELIKLGYSIEDIETKINSEGNKNIVLYCAGNENTAQFVHKSGRVSGVERLKAYAVTKSPFEVSPFITMDSKTGKISSGLVRGNQERAIKIMVNHVADESNRRKHQPIKFGIAYSRDQEVGQMTEYYLSRRFNLNHLNLIGPKETGSGIPVHAGPRIAVLGARWN